MEAFYISGEWKYAKQNFSHLDELAYVLIFYK
ncbi:MAG: hypothetical protein ACI88A_002514 [Paraglaciecola sp.]|jgi:hypothetical protein